jgi:hypothetical protein
MALAKTSKFSLLAASAAAVALLAGCSAAPAPTPKATIPPIPAPLSVDLATYDGKAIDLPMNRVLIINENGKPAKGIEGVATPKNLVQYVVGYSADAGKHFAPGILPNTAGKKGEAQIVISKGDLKAPVTLIVDVVAPILK